MREPIPGLRPAPETKRRRILLIGLDGLRWDIAAEDNVGTTLQKLAETGSFHQMTMEVPTISAPGWGSILTGSTHAQHGLKDNSCVGGRTWNRPDFLSQCFYQAQETRTFAAAGWPVLVDLHGLGPIIHPRIEQQFAGLHRVIVRDGETFGYPAVDAEITSITLAALKSGGFDVGFTYCCDVDDAGHIHGLQGNHYREAIKRVDAHVKSVTDMVAARHEAFGEEWLVILTTDHGHVDEGGHGGDSARERESWVITRSPDDYTTDWEKELRPEEITPLILQERNAS
ncbi:alkaline phosphatase family protein [Corynebacterium casei]|uniref:alkaline phosphatase family protein n=1 Tax=Corynebacterium casei TaxID=160386 RepID=UPI003FD5F1A6